MRDTKCVLSPRRVLVLIQVGVASLKEKAPTSCRGQFIEKNKTKTNPLSRFDVDHLQRKSNHIVQKGLITILFRTGSKT